MSSPPAAPCGLTPMSRSLAKRLHLQRPFYARLREWIASSPRKPANVAFTAGELRDAAYAIEDSGLLSSAEEAGRLRAEVAAFAKAALRSLMAEISEEEWCAGWLIDCEFDLWAAAVGDTDGFPDEAPRLAELAEKSGGWWTSREFVPLPEWRERYAKYWPQRLAEVERAKEWAAERGQVFVPDGSGVRLVDRSALSPSSPAGDGGAEG